MTVDEIRIQVPRGTRHAHFKSQGLRDCRDGLADGMSVTYPCDADPNPQFPSCSSSGNNRAAPSDSGEIMNVLEELPKRFQASIGNCCAFPKNGVL